MAGIKANSASHTMADGDTAPDQTQSGYLVAEQITLSTTGSPSSYLWALAKPSGATVRSDLSSTSHATPTFTPDAAGYWVVTCTVSGTTAYVLRLALVDAAPRTVTGGFVMLPRAPAAITAPAAGLGEALFYNNESSEFAAKNSAGTVRSLDPGKHRGSFSLVAGAATVADTRVTANTIVLFMRTTAGAAPGHLTVTLTAGTGFAVASSSDTDDGTLSYVLVNANGEEP